MLSYLSNGTMYEAFKKKQNKQTREKAKAITQVPEALRDLRDVSPNGRKLSHF